jgi:hypothetical protein
MWRRLIMLVVFKVDITNENQVISKDHGINIKAGTEIEFDQVPERVEQLIKMGIAASKEIKKAAAPKKAAPKK